MGVREDKQTDPFVVLQKEISTYILDNHKHPINISYLLKELKGHFPRLMNQILTIYKLEKEWGIDPYISGTDITEDENSIVDTLQ